MAGSARPGSRDRATLCARMQRRAYWLTVLSGGGVPEDARVTDDGEVRVTDDGEVRVIDS